MILQEVLNTLSINLHKLIIRSGKRSFFLTTFQNEHTNLLHISENVVIII